MYLTGQQSTQTGCYAIALLLVFHLNHLENDACITFKDIFPGLSRTKVIFHDFSGPGIFKKTNPGLSERCGNPAMCSTNPGHKAGGKDDDDHDRIQFRDL